MSKNFVLFRCFVLFRFVSFFSAPFYSCFVLLCSVLFLFRFVLFCSSVLFCLFVCLFVCLLACLFTGVLCDLKLKLFFWSVFLFVCFFWCLLATSSTYSPSRGLVLFALITTFLQNCRLLSVRPGCAKKNDCILQIEKITAYPRISCMTVCYVSTCFQQLICYESRSFDLWSCKLEISQQFCSLHEVILLYAL